MMLNKMKLMTVAMLLTVGITISSNALSFADTQYGAAGAAQDDTLTIEAMLTYAIQDEYLARAEYEVILENYDVERPFSNIINAEERHISWLEPLFETYGFVIPEDDASSHVVLPELIQDIYTTGVNAEVQNIDMYASFLEQELPEDIRSVFTALKSASENHLVAFERQVSRQTSTSNAPVNTGRQTTRRMGMNRIQ